MAGHTSGGSIHTGGHIQGNHERFAVIDGLHGIGIILFGNTHGSGSEQRIHDDVIIRKRDAFAAVCHGMGKRSQRARRSL